MREDDNWVHGRENVVHALARSECPVTILVGDSGVGKSTVLRAAQLVRGDALSPEPVRMGHGPAALQRALSEALAAALHDLAEETDGLPTIVERARFTVFRTAVTAVDRLHGEVMHHLMDLVRARYGDTLADTLADVNDAWRQSHDEALRARITSVGDPDVIRVLLRLGDEVAERAQRPLLLALDNLHHAGDDDQRRLADLFADVGEAVRLRLTFTTLGMGDRVVLDRLRSVGAHILPLGSLEEQTVRAWLVREGQPEILAPAVMRATSGYAFHVRDAISLLAGGATAHDLEQLSRNDVVSDRTTQAWACLSGTAQRAALQLSAFPEPLAVTVAAGHLGLDALGWSQVRRELVDAGLFIERGDEAWFHELRRVHVWNNLLDPAARADVARAAVDLVRSRLDAAEELDVEDIILFARLLFDARTRIELSPQVDTLLDCDDDEAGVVAALMELSENTEDNWFVSADAVLVRARALYATSDRVFEALHRLREREVVAYASNERNAVVAPAWGSGDASLLIAGRAARQFDRLPIPGAASAIMSRLNLQLGPFRLARHGIGRLSSASLSHSARRLQQQQLDGSLHVGRGGPNLLVEARYGDTPWHAAIAYDAVASRDAAREAVRGHRVKLWAQDLVVTDAVAHPLPPVASRRFIAAAEALFGISLGTVFSSRAIRDPLLPPLTWELEMAQRAATIDAVRELCSSEERRAYDLEQPIGLAWCVTIRDGSDGSSCERVDVAEIRGRRGDQRLRQSPWSTLHSPFTLLKMTLLADLRPGEAIGHLWADGGERCKNPVVDELSRLSQRAENFGKAQDRMLVSLDVDELTERLTSALMRRYDDAVALGEAIPGLSQPPPSKPDTMLAALVIREDPDSPWGPEFRMKWVQVDRIGDENTVRVAVVDRPPASNSYPWDEPPDWLSGVFDIHDRKVSSSADGVTSFVLAELLGHHEQEIDVKGGARMT